MSKNYGFARCSLGEEKGQDINRQVRELKAAGAEEIIAERVHGDAKLKPQLDFLLEHIEPNSTLYVTVLCDPEGEGRGRATEYAVTPMPNYYADLPEQLWPFTVGGNITAAGICAHESALRNGEMVIVPVF